LTQESSVIVEGKVRADKRAPGGYELDVSGVQVLQRVSESDPYPISLKEHGVEFLMEHRHLWVRTPRQAAILRVRAEMKDFRFHDLRHEATSRLFERGYEIHEVEQFTLHSSWQQLVRYTHLRPEQVPALPYESPPSPHQPASSSHGRSVPKHSISRYE